MYEQALIDYHVLGILMLKLNYPNATLWEKQCVSTCDKRASTHVKLRKSNYEKLPCKQIYFNIQKQTPLPLNSCDFRRIMFSPKVADIKVYRKRIGRRVGAVRGGEGESEGRYTDGPGNIAIV